MVVTCCVVGCHNRRNGKEKRSFHKFPWKNEVLANQWVASICRQNPDGKPWKPTPNDRVCSDHFTTDDYQSYTTTRILKPDAKPTVFPIYSSHRQISAGSKRPPPKDRSLLPANLKETPYLKRRRLVNAIAFDHSYAQENKSIEEQLELEKEKNRVLTEKVANSQRKIRALQGQVVRKEKKLDGLLLDVERLKYIDSDKLKLLTASLSDGARLLFDNQLKLGKSAPQCRRYNEEIKAFAVTLHFYSPQAYEFLRKHLILPDVSTIQRWASSVTCEPGFLSNVLDHIQQLKEKNPLMADVCLMFDSMALKSEVTFDEKDGGVIGGFVNYGASIECEDILATEALVVMVVGLRTHWKQPIAYFLVDKVCSTVQSQIVKDAICHMSDRGFTVHATVCDGNFANQKTAVELGCCLDTDKMCSHFPHPQRDGEHVYFLFDVCHLLKNMRNCLGQLGTILDSQGNAIRWSYISGLHKTQLTDNLVLANKLSGRHIDFEKNKMNVKLAAQTLSSSVADAIDFLREDKKLPEFQDSEATTLFIRKVDQVFDILNSSNPFGKGYKAPINVYNFNNKMSVLLRFADYIRGLCSTMKQPLMLGRRKTAFIGFLMTIMSIQGLATRVLKSETNQFKYLLTYKLSQDHLETFFSRMRRRGGWNNNPTCVQFRFALRACLMKNGIQPSKKANCVELDDEGLTEGILSLDPGEDKNEVKQPRVINQFLELIKEPSMYHDDVLFYIAGYICRQLSRLIKCAKCIAAVVRRASTYADLPDDPNTVFLLRKDRGGLLASNDIFQIVKEADSVLTQLMKVHRISTLGTKAVVKVQMEVCERLKEKLFLDIQEHNRDTFKPLDGDHITQITKCTCQLYTKMVMRHNANIITERFLKENKGSVRHKLTKTILFLHQ